MERSNINICRDIEELTEAFSQTLVVRILEILKKQPFVNLALSGGSTPQSIFRHLSLRYKDSVEWNKVRFFWGDERCVLPEDKDSNYKLAEENLFRHIEVNLENIFRIKGENDPAREVKNYADLLNATLPEKNGKPAFDIVLLGMGEDGHTASIFPNQMSLMKTKNDVAVATHPISGQKRITLTGNIINNSSNVMFAVAGRKKSKRIKEIFNNKEIAVIYPAYHIKPVEGQLYWFLDQAAASQLNL